MATTMFSGSTSSERRKKVVYGKSSRLSTVLPPASDPSDDAPPSPDRPRKPTAASRGALKDAGGTTKAGDSLGNAPAKEDNADIFDIPPEDEFVARPKPTRRLGTKPRTPDAGPGAPVVQEQAPLESKKPVKLTQPLRKPGAAKPSAAPKKTQKAIELPKLSQAPLSSSSNSMPSRMLRGKTPQPSELPKPAADKAKAAQQTTAPVPSDATKAQNDRNTSSVLPKKKLPAKPTNRPTRDLSVFDVPSSEDEAPLTVKKAPRQTQAARRKETAPGADQTQPPESDDSSASKKRKRRGSVSSANTVAKPASRQKSGSSVSERNRKSQKKEDDDSPGYTSQTQTNASVNRKAPSTALQATAPATNKPGRTSQRTVPMLGPPKTVKGQSSPAMLSSMLPSRQPAKSFSATEEPPVSELDDQTMYDIPDPMTTPVRAPRAAVPGSTTPRQRTLFGGLLGDDTSASTPMSIMSSLQLTDKKPRSLVGGLSRSKSDLTHSAQGRKTRLIDTLKPAESSSDEEEESSSEDLEVRRDKRRSIQRPAQVPVDARSTANPPSDDMEIEVQADSQPSQGTSGFGMRPKLTYAMSRSYLREANPEDDLMMTMDLDDGFGGHSPSRDTVSVSEDDPDQTSQAQAHHELKSRGRNYVFQQEAQSMIDDISSTSTTSIRRSAMIELCTKMADETFCSQLLDSPLAHQFFRNIAVGGEIVFEFATALVIIFILRTNPACTVLDQLYEAGSLAILCKLLGNDLDIQKIAKDRKTNLSKIAKDAVIALGSLVQQSSIWSPATMTKVTPRLVSMKAVELLVLGLRKTGNADALLDQQIISRLAEIATSSNQRLEANEGKSEDEAMLLMVLSTLESASATRQKQAAWPTAVLQRIADFMPRFFQADAATSTMLAVKLCMNVTNNKPKACQSFSAKTFVEPLMLSIIERFQLLNEGSAGEKRTETLESLILSLGATINLAEFSDQMRVNTDGNQETIDKLVKLFSDGSERASQAQSVEESHSGVAIGYLAVLLGNLCLNDLVRTKIRALLPDQQLTTLIDSIKEFVRVHEHVDRRKEDFEGAEGQEALQSYTARLMLVVERLQRAT